MHVLLRPKQEARWIILESRCLFPNPQLHTIDTEDILHESDTHDYSTKIPMQQAHRIYNSPYTSSTKLGVNFIGRKHNHMVIVKVGISHKNGML